MTKEKADKMGYWILIIGSVLGITTYVWTSATKFQMIDSRSLENLKKIERFQENVDKKLIRIEDKIDDYFKRK